MSELLHPKSLTDKIRQNIKRRIYVALLLISLIPFILTLYSYFNTRSQLQNEVYTEVVKLGDYIIGQYLVNNMDAIRLKLEAFNRVHTYKVVWKKDNAIQQEKQIFKTDFRKFTLIYPLYIENITNNKFGYLIITDNISLKKIVNSGLIEIVVIPLIFALLLYFLLIPLATHIPQNLILEPINHIIGIIEKDGGQLKSKKGIVYYEEIRKIEVQIKNLISLVETQSKDAAIGILAKRVIHNLKSPLLVLQNCKNKLKNFAEIDEKLIKDLSISIDNIKYTLINLLNTNTENKFQTQEDSDKPRYLLLKPLIDEIVNQKTIEWHNQCELIYVDNTKDDNIWIHTLHFNFISAISNLLNNSFESFKTNTKGMIKLNLYKVDDGVILNIKDNGCGIEKSILHKVMNGYSTKSSGQGIGLSTAINYFKEFGGKLDVVSTSVGHGTSIDVKMPNISLPVWLPSRIDILDYIVILDDAVSIHSYLQSIFTRIPNVKYFREIAEFKLWAKENTHILGSVTYFIDNQLEEGLEHGIDLIKSYKIMSTAYLTTNEYENQLIQETAATFHIKIIPKPLLKSMLNL